MTPSSSPRPQPTFSSGRYRVQRKLGTGSMGSVYLAHDAMRAELVALKIIRADRMRSAAVAKMQEEFRAVATIRHPRIARAFDFGYVDETGFPFYTSEYVRGEPLPPGPPPQDVAPRMYLQPLLDLLEALVYLHDRSLLHLDIHAGNLIVAADPQRGSVLIDLGLTRSFAEPGPSSSPRGQALLPPELVHGEVPSPQSDLYLVGRLLLYRLTGSSEGEPRLPREIPGWGARSTLDLERIVSKAIQPSPRQRFQSAREFRDALATVVGESRAQETVVGMEEVTVGRAWELERIESALRDAAAGCPSVLVFRGGRGSGKTRLLRECRIRAQLRGLEVVGVEFETERASEAVLESSLRRVSPPRRWLEPLDARHGGTPEERAQRAAEVLCTEGGLPLVILLDDLHLADAPSRLLAAALCAEARRRRESGLEGRGLVVVATSTGEGAGSLDASARELRPLRKVDARLLLETAMRPLSVPAALARRILARAEGSPLRLGQIASHLKRELGPLRVLPATAELPALADEDDDGDLTEIRKLPAASRVIVEALAVADRPMAREEVAAAVEKSTAAAGRVLRKLERDRLVRGSGRARTKRFRIASSLASRTIKEETSRGSLLRVHRRLAAHLRSRTALSPNDHENLARHLLVCGRRAEAATLAIDLSRKVDQTAASEAAVRLLEEIRCEENDDARLLELAAAQSDVLERIGDHRRGITVLEPLVRSGAPPGLLRRLGVHYHRSGEIDKALETFDRARRRAEPERDTEDLIVIDSELAELLTFRGAFEGAEKACRRGLELVSAAPSHDRFRSRMEMILRASLGHLHLRRFELDAARAELKVAWSRSERGGTTAERAAILNNLGIVENHRDSFRAAEEAFLKAERLLEQAGEHRGLIHVGTNLAVIVAKLGRRDDARLRIEQAAHLVRHYPGRPFEFFVGYARGIVHHLFGEEPDAIRELQQALRLGSTLGDSFLVGFGEVYLAEALLAAGRYVEASRQLRSAERRAQKEHRPLLARMVYARLLCLSVLQGQSRASVRWRNRFLETPRSRIAVLEAWNDLFVGFAFTLIGAEHRARGRELLRAARGEFSKLGVPAGERLALLARRLAPTVEDDCGDEPEEVQEIGDVDESDGADSSPEPHRLAAVAEPLAAAEEAFARGDVERAGEQVSRASSAIVGSPFLELDWRIELLRSRIALHGGELRDARRHLHRALHTRDLLARGVATRSRPRFMKQPRFAVLEQTASRLERAAPLQHSTRRLRRGERYEGMIGQSSSMTRLFQTIERLRGQSLNVLVCGETGSGKELVARALHRSGIRRDSRLFAIHCASLPGELFESELFGYEAGAFTEATECRPGILEEVNGGTVFLDEVGQLPMSSQAKLLRFLDSGTCRRVGGTEERRLDVRVIASSSDDLAEAVQAGAFRRDLYYRLRGAEIVVPPLRARRADVRLLARAFIERHARRLDRPVPSLTEEALRALEEYEWPGNVRELDGALLRILLGLSARDRIEAADVEAFLGPRREGPFDRRIFESWSYDDLRHALEREYLRHVYRRERGSPERMMKALGLKRTQLYERFKQAGLDVRRLRRELDR